MDYCSDIKSNEIGSLVEMWLDLETYIQSLLIQRIKSKKEKQIHVNAHMWN